MVVMNERKYSVMELIKMLEEALPKGQVVVVGNGESLTDKQKAFLHSLTDCECDGCPCEDDCEYSYTEEEYEAACEEAYESGKADGYEECEKSLSEAYDEGYSDGENSREAEIIEAYNEGYADALREVKNALGDLL